MLLIRTSIVLLAALILAAPVFAEPVATTRNLTIQFTGELVEGPEDTLWVRGLEPQPPEAQPVPYAGDLPAYPIAAGDTFTYTIDANLPNGDFFAALPETVRNADGTYNYQLDVDPFGVPGVDPGFVNSFGPSSPLRLTDNFGQPTTFRMDLVYDPATDSYALAPFGGFSSASYAAVGYLFDAATQEYVLCGTPSSADCRGSIANDPVITNLASTTGWEFLRTGGIRVNSTDPNSPAGTGFFDLSFFGGWNLPIYGSNPTPVPAPGMLLLFALGAGVVLRRRSNQKRA